MVANSWVPLFTNRKDRRQPKRGSEGKMIARLSHFTRSHTSVLTLSLSLVGLIMDGALREYSELIVFHIDKALLVRVRTHKCAEGA